MNVVVLGGVGAMGSHTTRYLAGDPTVDRVTVAGLEAERDASARRFPELPFESVDVRNPSAVADLVERHDVVVNATGPFFELLAPVLSGVLEAGDVAYVDICDDVGPTRQALARHDEAERRGCRVLVGLGLSPGCTNLLARMAAERLDLVTELHTMWDLAAAVTVDDEPWDGETPAALVHWMHCCSGEAPILLDGHWTTTQPVTRIDLATVDDAPLPGWTVAHPEPIGLARTYPELRASLNLMRGPTRLFTLLREIRDDLDREQLTLREAAAHLAQRGIGTPITQGAERATRAHHDGAYLVAVAEGTVDGEAARAQAELITLPPGGMGAATGIPAAIGAIAIADNAIPPGVHTPEAVIDPAWFFDRYASTFGRATAIRVRTTSPRS
jgi:saccharopine dehydrogenase-like NADP-dependent oxidoreductase